VRQPDPVTGFDPADDMPLDRLRVGVDKANQSYTGPYPLVNTAMNLVEGDELAWQERKAESFLLSPCYSGSATTGYRRLMSSDSNGMRLGTAVAMSGAAVSPNWGYHSSPAVTALLTIFNVRLGGWVRNPRYGIPNSRGPGLGLLWLLKELFGRTNNRADYVYLSDGGHFDNLGVYELVRRRCRFIVACDGEQDGDYTFDALGALIRKCETDFGVRIEIDVNPIRPHGELKRSRWHCAVGKIAYNDVHPEGAPGILLYLKASLTGDEPEDVLTYAQENPPFPHQTTLNQFFTESQFESYRALGLHIAHEVFCHSMTGLVNPVSRDDAIQRQVVNTLFSRLHSRWFPPPPDFNKSFLESVQGYVEIERALGSDKNLRAFSESMYKEIALDHDVATLDANDQRDAQRAELHLVSQMLQVMENAWLTVNLEGYFAHPMNRGWMNTLRRWTSSAKFRKYWPLLHGEFSKDFVEFCKNELQLRTFDVVAEPLEFSEELLANCPPESHEPAAQRRWRHLLTFRQEFHWEWPDQEELAEIIRKAWRGAPAIGGVWQLKIESQPGAPPEDHSEEPIPCGIIVIWQPDANSKQLEVLVWIRGPYRDCGLGRKAIRKALHSVAGKYQGFQLVTRYPIGEGLLCREEQARNSAWRTFYGFYGFRPVESKEQAPKYLVLNAGPTEWQRLL
jgi:hypothetical protein